jgi:quercetin dioxygenase-like cupin family protein
MSVSSNRRVRVGLDDAGRSIVVADGHDLARAAPSAGVSIEEIWWQEAIPARTADVGARSGRIGLAAPPGGAVVRILTVPPSPADSVVDLHSDPSMHVITLTAGRLEVVLEVGTVTLDAGDTVVLPASVHDLHNPTDEPATFVYTSFPLVS